MEMIKKKKPVRRGKQGVYLIAIISIIIASVVLLYQSEKTLFPDKLGDMELKLHREGDVAIREIKGSHEAKDNVSPRDAHVARYRNSAGSRATVSLTVAETNQRAVEIVENMNRGMRGMFSMPETLERRFSSLYS